MTEQYRVTGLSVPPNRRFFTDMNGFVEALVVVRPRGTLTGEDLDGTQSESAGWGLSVEKKERKKGRISRG